MKQFDNKPMGMYSIEAYYAREYEGNKELFIAEIRHEAVKSKAAVLLSNEWSIFLPWERRKFGVWLASGSALSSLQKYTADEGPVPPAHGNCRGPKNILYSLPYDLSRLIILYL